MKNARFLHEEGGADVKCRDGYGRTPLTLAAREGHADMVRFLTEEAGADVDRGNSSGWTPTFAAALFGHLEVARILVEERGADANKVERDGWTPLHASACTNMLEVAEWLVTKRGADVFQTTNDGDTPLSLAIEFSSTAVVPFLQHWTLSVLPRRTVLASVNLARRHQPKRRFVPELLRHLCLAGPFLEGVLSGEEQMR